MELKEFKDALRAIETQHKRVKRLSEKRANMSGQTHTQKSIQNADANLNWECMYLEQRKIDFARMFEGSELDVDTSEREFNPSPFHKYKY